MKMKSKKAFTLVEMIVSIALIALISMMLLGFVIPAAKMQGTAEGRNKGIHSAAQLLETKAFTDPNITPTPGYSLNLGSNTCTGTLYKSTNGEVDVWEFVPN